MASTLVPRWSSSISTRRKRSVKKFHSSLSLSLLCLLVLFFPRSSPGQSLRVGARLASSSTSASQPAAQPLSASNWAATPLTAFNTDFGMLPSVTSSSFSLYGDGLQKLSLKLFCFDLLTGNIIPNCDITVVPSAQPNSGGHLHNPHRS